MKILADVEVWAMDDTSNLVFWLVGMAGTGKSTISQTVCECLDAKDMLGASFFCSRASNYTNNAYLIIPSIAYELARTSPSIKSEVIKAIEDDNRLTEPTYSNLEDLFTNNPLQKSIGNVKTIVIDGMDECTNLDIFISLLKLILQYTHKMSLKIFISSQGEVSIRNVFGKHPNTLVLHEVEKDVVEDDIRRYITRKLDDIKSHFRIAEDDMDDGWPSPSELSELIRCSGRLFIYAATAIHYIEDGKEDYQHCLSNMVNSEPKSGSKQTSNIDILYGSILEQVFSSKEEDEVTPRRQLLSIIIFLRNLLSIQAILTLSGMGPCQLLSLLSSVIYIPSHMEDTIAPFHASFPDFLTDPTHCSDECCPSFHALSALDGHAILALKCLEHLNNFSKYNICEVPAKSTVSCRETINPLDGSNKVSKALKYSCVYWASHLAELQLCGDESDLITALRIFLEKHLLHWIEYLSVIGELQTGLTSLRGVATALSVSSSLL